ncbi:hypothetical protein QVD17_31890 [Tagetes erecta]|uniref:Uncharacterized protein n=1 Tax=Tagetes erecta TaxID=13708 RepID=A0AAD8NP76_TARER|nr:hypothetical protein QVD17_31890 [Tagetes erecta]
MDAQAWNESLGQIESMIVELIDFLKNRPRLAPPVSATTSSSPNSTPKHRLSSTSSTQQPTFTETKYYALNVVVLFCETRALIGNRHDFESWFKSRGISMRSKISQGDEALLVALKLQMYIDEFTRSLRKQVSVRATRKQEWRPPWYSITTSPNSARRTECGHHGATPKTFWFHLEDKVNFEWGGLLCTSLTTTGTSLLCVP